MKPDIKKVLSRIIKGIDNKYGLMLSSGIDSRCLFFESIEQKKDFVCYSFRMDNIISTDFSEAKELCNSFNIEHREILLPSDISVLKNDIVFLKKIGAKTKTDFECFWPFLYVYKEVREKTILSGLAADGHFCISKRAMIHYRDRPDEFRSLLFDNPRYCQMPLHENYINEVEHIVPFLSNDMISEFKGTTWDEINKPKQKYPIIAAYKSYFDKIKLYKHTSYQMGDSGIQKHFNRLLDTELNTGGFKSVVSIFNRIEL